MIQGCINNAIKTDNNIINQAGSSEQLPPTTIVTGIPPPNFESIISLKFGDYVQVFEGTTNTNKSRTQGAIALYPSGNLQQGWIFMSLLTGREVHRKQWTQMTINQKVIDRVNALGEKDGQPLVADNFEFTTKSRQSVRTTTKNNQEGTSPVYKDEGGVTRVHEVHHDDVDESSWVESEDPIPEFDSEINKNEFQNELESHKSEGLSENSWKKRIDDLENQFLEDIDEIRNKLKNDANDDSTKENENTMYSEDEYSEVESERDVENDDDIESENGIDDDASEESDILSESNDDESKGEASTTEAARSSRLRDRERVDYAKLHRFGETQLL